MMQACTYIYHAYYYCCVQWYCLWRKVYKAKVNIVQMTHLANETW